MKYILTIAVGTKGVGVISRTACHGLVRIHPDSSRTASHAGRPA